MVNIEAILARFTEELSQSSEQTKQHRGFYARKFLGFAQGRPFTDWNKTLVISFQRQMEREGYAPGTCRNVYGIVKRVFDAAKAVHEAERTRLISEANPSNPAAVAEILKAMSLPGPTWDVGKRAAPRVEAEDMVKPAATIEEMQTMIAAAKDGLLTTAERAHLALGSVYGLRREEHCRVRPEHLDLKGKTIYVMTCKGGERRKQLLCDEIIPHLAEYGFNEVYSSWQMSAMYWRIAAKSGLSPPAGSGWHSLRRNLDTVLRDLFGELYAKIFMRWKISSSQEMVERYYSRDPLQIDHEILTGEHPIVQLWR